MTNRTKVSHKKKILKKRINWKRQALAAERLRFESVKSFQTRHDPIRVDLLALGVSHEFNNILGAALGHAEWALDTKDSSDMKEALEVIRTACIRCSKITKSLQGIVQPREEKKTIYSLEKLYQELDKLWEPRARNQKIKLFFEREDLNIYLDPGAVIEILSNLIKNSFEIFESSNTLNPKIQVLTKLQKKNVQIFVKDNGPGVSPVYRPFLFQPFFSTKGTINAVFKEEKKIDAGSEANLNPKNSGLGLYLSKALAQEMGGNLELIEDKENLGACFILTLPLVS